MAGKPGKRGKRPLRLKWADWSDLPVEVRSAVVWAFYAGGPADVVDQERYEAALNSGAPFHEAAFLEEPRWMVRSLRALNEAGAFKTRLPMAHIYEAVGLWMGKSAASVKREAGGYGLRGKPRSSRWAVEAAQDWMKEHHDLDFLAKVVSDFGPVMHLVEAGCYNASFESWRMHFGDAFGRQIKARWANRVLRKYLFLAKDGVHFGYVMRDLPTSEGPGSLVNHFYRLEPTPLQSLDLAEVDFSFWLNRWLSHPGASAIPPSKMDKRA
ncbi:MAG: hypothetical protein H6P99_1821 [Holophagaceae bacterium]|nr:hypothetical protein [Holophagaceae bacterium]